MNKILVNTFVLRMTVLITFIGMVTINALANLLPINGITTDAVSNLYPTYFVPAGYVFTIWSVIYITLFIFAVYQLKQQSSVLTSLRIPFIVSCIANGVWILLWHYGHIYLTVIAMLVLLICLLMMYLRVKDIQPTMTREYWFVRTPFSIYLGWISVATVANISAALYAAQWNGFSIDPQIWSSIMMCVAAGLGITMLLRHKDIAYALVIVWALVGIGMRFNTIPLLYGVAYSLAVLVGIGCVVSAYQLKVRR